jgi:hypothetical protein
MHGDLCGPIKLATSGSKNMFLLLVDDRNWFMWIVLLRMKDEAATAIKKVQARAEAECGKKLRVL